MSIYDRDYMRRREPQSWWGRNFGETPAVGCLIAANIAMFFLCALFPRLFDVLALTKDNLLGGMAWTAVTYSFLHAGPLHILLNMLGLYFMGSPLERWLGWKKFLAVYFGGVVLGAAAWLGASWLENSALAGASAGVMAVMAAFCMLYPPVPITFLVFFVIPVSVRPKTMLKIVAAVEIFSLIFSKASGGGSDIAYAAHLGGIAAGLGVVELLRRGKLAFLDAQSASPFARFRRRRKPRPASDFKFKVDVSGNSSDEDEIDRILDKINAEGFASLSEDERETLRRAGRK